MYLPSYNALALTASKQKSLTNSGLQSTQIYLEAPVFAAFTSRPSSSPAPCPTSAATAITSQP